MERIGDNGNENLELAVKGAAEIVSYNDDAWSLQPRTNSIVVLARILLGLSTRHWTTNSCFIFNASCAIHLHCVARILTLRS